MQANGQVVATIAGVDSAGYNGDGIPATTAQLNLPCNIIFDRIGNLYIADYFNVRIRKIDTAGTITTVAGNGGDGYSGDGGPATDAQITPVDVAIDRVGNLYIADWENNAIRKVNTSGIISTIAGEGPTIWGYNGDGENATAALLYLPSGVAVDSVGNVYIADDDNNRIRKINTSGVITTVAGNGTMGTIGDGGPATDAELLYPGGVAVDEFGNIIITDFSRVRKINTFGVISTIIGGLSPGFGGDGGPATAALLSDVYHAVPDTMGNIYIADANNERIRKVNTSGIINTIAGTDSAGYNGDGLAARMTWLGAPSGVAYDATGNIFIADYGNNRIRKINNNFAPITGADTVCDSFTIVLADTTAGGIWASNNPAIATVGSLSGIVTGVSFGADTIRYSASGVTANATIVVQMASECLSLDIGNGVRVGKYANVQILPNPAVNELDVTHAKGCELVMYDMVGRAVLKASISIDKQMLDISNLQSGVYVVQVVDETSGYRVTRRVVKE